MSQELIFLEPVLKEMIWGGERLKEFGYELPGANTGECWAISAHPHGDCRVAGGRYDGAALSGLWAEHRELFGDKDGDRFPLLVKIIDASRDLSIQVHPDDRYAAVHEQGSLGKTECWYVLGCPDGADIVIGHHAKSDKELREMILQERWDDFLRVIPIQKGDFFQIEPGCLHAIRKGTVILETQQSSDITYRVYDYGRLENGKPRQLHVRQSLEVIRVPFDEKDTRGCRRRIPAAGGTRELLVCCPKYSVELVCVEGKMAVNWEKPFVNVTLVEGEGLAAGLPVKKGTNFLVPAGFGRLELEGQMELICSYL